jgi:hypothetical protein
LLAIALDSTDRRNHTRIKRQLQAPWYRYIPQESEVNGQSITIVTRAEHTLREIRQGFLYDPRIATGEIMAKNDRTVSRRPDGTWANKKDGASKAGSVHERQSDAISAAHEMLVNSGGGELKVKGIDGKIRSKDTIAPGNDPNPPKDSEH